MIKNIPKSLKEKTFTNSEDGIGTTKNIAYLDGWRGLAIISVLVAHFSGPGSVAWMGGFGVALFFALSGFLMSRLLFIKRVNLNDFFARRFNRVIPTFFLFVSAMALYAATIQPVKYYVSTSDLLATFLFVRTYVPSEIDIFSDYWPAGHLWSLSVEEHSYIFLALIALSTRLTKNNWLIGGLLVTSTLVILGFNTYYSYHPPVGASPWALRSECAALGLVLSAAIRYIRHITSWEIIKNPSRLLPVLSFMIAIACFSTYSHKSIASSVGVFCLAFSVNYLDRVPIFFTKLLSLKLLRWFGACSFSLYLWQQPFYLEVHYHGAHKLIFLMAAISMGLISFYFFENPIRIKLNSLWKKRSAQISNFRSEASR